MQNKISIQDVELPINLGVNYFYKYYLEYTGHDLLKTPQLVENPEDLEGLKAFELASNLISAGHRAAASLNRMEPTFSRDDIEHMINSLTGVEAVGLFYKLMSVINADKDPNGEAPKKKGLRKAG